MITLYAFGKIKGSAFEEACLFYEKRLAKVAKIVELPAVSCGKDYELQKVREGNLLLSKLGSDDVLVLLDERGFSLSSKNIAGVFEKINLQGKKVVMAIGGHAGFSDEVRHKAKHMISFGKATFPHLMVRLMALEQIYRGDLILKGHPYHRD